MSKVLGFVKYSPDDKRETLFGDKPYSDDTGRLIDDEIRRLIDEAFRDATRLIDENWEKACAVAEALLKYETLDADEVRKLCCGESLDKPSLSGLLADETVAPPRAKPVPQPPSLELPPGLAGGSLPQPGVG